MRAVPQFLLLFCVWFPPVFLGQASGPASQGPLPDIATLLRDVEAHQASLEKTRENYTYLRRVVTTELNKNGGVKKTESEDGNVFYVHTHEIERTLRRNGKDLSPSEQKKEQDKVSKEVEKAEKTPPGESLNGDSISVGRLLQIMRTSAPRPATLDGRGMILFDFTGDAHAKTHGRAENASKKITGTVWIDQQDRQVRRLVALFQDNFSVGFGLAAVAKGSSFSFDQKLVNNELWLPTSAHIHIIGKALGFVGYRGEIQIDDSNYQRFHTQAEQAH